MAKLMKWLMVILIPLFSLTITSCSDDKDDEPSATVGTITITNSSTYTLDNFMVNFTSVSGEVITKESKGTIKPKETVKVDIPIGAKLYYMSTTANGTRFFSADYEVSVKKQILTNEIVGNWSSN